MHRNVGSAEAGSILSVRFSFRLSLFPDEYTITAGLANGGYSTGSFREIISYLQDVSGFVALPRPNAPTWEGMINLQPTLCFDKI